MNTKDDEEWSLYIAEDQGDSWYTLLNNGNNCGLVNVTLHCVYTIPDMHPVSQVQPLAGLEKPPLLVIPWMKQ